MGLYRIVYHSRASDKMKDSQIFNIVEKAQKHNKEVGITGLLLFISNSFIQLLEGEEKEVKASYQKIMQDERHDQSKIILQGNITKRDFTSWNMGLKIFTKQDIMDLKEINQNQDFDLLKDLKEKQDLAIEFMRFFYNHGKIDFYEFWKSQNDIETID